MKADAVIVTHAHADHCDDVARQRLPKDRPVFAQKEKDAESIRKDGFTDVRVLTENTLFKGTRLSKTGGGDRQPHGSGRPRHADAQGTA